jgi:hypothetical protein
MWQALNSAGLRAHPFEAVWFLHKQPPFFDALRALLIGLLRGVPDEQLGVRLDGLLYVVWALVVGASAVLVCRWLQQSTSRLFASIMAIVWSLLPASVYYATFLEPTVVVSFGVLWVCLELRRLSSGGGSIPRLTSASLLLFFTRATFQWPFLASLLVCLLLMRLPRRRVWAFVAACVLVAGPYTWKQWHVFHMTGTTFVPRHSYYLVAGSEMPTEAFEAKARAVPWTYPPEAALSEGKFNTEEDWRKSFAFSELAVAHVREHPVTSLKNVLITFMVFNWNEYWRPSAEFTPNVAVQALPWSEPFHRIFAYPVNLGLLLLALWQWRRRRREAGLAVIDGRTVGVALPIAYIFLTSTLVNGDGHGWTEAVRYKFFLEAVFFVFSAEQLYGMAERYLAGLRPPTVGEGGL